MSARKNGHIEVLLHEDLDRDFPGRNFTSSENRYLHQARLDYYGHSKKELIFLAEAARFVTEYFLEMDPVGYRTLLMPGIAERGSSSHPPEVQMHYWYDQYTDKSAYMEEIETTHCKDPDWCRKHIPVYMPDGATSNLVLGIGPSVTIPLLGKIEPLLPTVYIPMLIIEEIAVTSQTYIAFTHRVGILLDRIYKSLGLPAGINTIIYMAILSSINNLVPHPLAGMNVSRLNMMEIYNSFIEYSRRLASGN